MVAFAPHGTPHLPRLLRRSFGALLAKTGRGRASSLSLALSQRERECCHCVDAGVVGRLPGWFDWLTMSGRVGVHQQRVTMSGGLVKRSTLITNLLHYYRKLDYVEYLSYGSIRSG